MLKPIKRAVRKKDFLRSFPKKWSDSVYPAVYVFQVHVRRRAEPMIAVIEDSELLELIIRIYNRGMKLIKVIFLVRLVHDLCKAHLVLDHRAIVGPLLLISDSLSLLIEDLGDLCLIDGNQMPPGLPCPANCLIRGDSLSACVAAASILAKVHRDRLMADFDPRYPLYGFAKHKGYGTAAHLQAISDHGPCPIHRRSFAPLSSL